MSSEVTPPRRRASGPEYSVLSVLIIPYFSTVKEMSVDSLDEGARMCLRHASRVQWRASYISGLFQQDRLEPFQISRRVS